MLIKVNNEIRALSRDLEVRLVTGEILDLIWTRFFEVVELSDSLDIEACDHLLSR